jgi:hypothetical protein
VVNFRPFLESPPIYRIEEKLLSPRLKKEVWVDFLPGLEMLKEAFSTAPRAPIRDLIF